jgi:hypothetical protein
VLWVRGEVVRLKSLRLRERRRDGFHDQDVYGNRPVLNSQIAVDMNECQPWAIPGLYVEHPAEQRRLQVHRTRGSATVAALKWTNKEWTTRSFYFRPACVF